MCQRNVAISEHVPTKHQNFESRKRASDFNQMATEHKKCHAKDPEPFQPKDKTRNAPPGAMDVAIGDDAKDPGQLQQKGSSAAEPENAVAGSMGEWTDRDTTTAAALKHHDRPTGHKCLKLRSTSWKQGYKKRQQG